MYVPIRSELSALLSYITINTTPSCLGFALVLLAWFMHTHICRGFDGISLTVKLLSVCVG